MPLKILKQITQALLLSVIAVTPFIKISSLYFPFVSGKAYIFRALVMLAFFFWVWLLLKNQELRINFRNVLVLALILFFLAQVFVSFFGVDPFSSFFSDISRAEGVLQYGFWILYFLMLVSVFKESRDWKILFFVFTIVAFLTAFLAWLGFPPDKEIYGNIFGNPAYLSGFLIFAIAFSLLIFIEDSDFILQENFFRGRLVNNLFLAAAVFFAFTLVVSQIRGVFIGLMGGVFLFCFLSILFLRKTSRKLAHSAGIILLISIIFLASLFAAKNIDFVKNSPTLSRLTTLTDIKEISSARERLFLWQIAWQAFLDKPVFGWGPENFAPAFNKYYSHWAGEKEAWFDRAHNIPLGVLAGGGIFLFSFYSFLLYAVVHLIFKISRKKKVLSFILVAVFFAYFLQGLFFFDTFAAFLGLFPFLAYLVYESRQGKINFAEGQASSKFNKYPNKNYSKIFSVISLVAAGFFSLLVICASVIIPWRANALALRFYTHTEADLYSEAKQFLEKSFAIKSPYTYWQVRKESGWQFLKIMEDKIDSTTAARDIKAIEEIYDFIVPELERFIEEKPHDPQMYYVLGRVYLSGFERLGMDDLQKAKNVLEKARNFSDLRKEYVEELKRVLFFQAKFDEAGKMIKEYAKKVNFYDYYPYLTLGHFYFDTEKYEQALEQYQMAKEASYDFCRISAEYSRYMLSAEKASAYQSVVDMAKKCLEKWGPDADTFFNIAVGYLHLGEKEKAIEFFLKAVELNSEYEKDRSFFD